MIYIRTTAYNASQTLQRTVESVLNQTYGEFKYYLIDNGSTDNGKTRNIVEKYAEQDSRIVPFFNERNHDWSQSEEARLLPHRIEENDYFCLLDADDEYLPTFFEDMLNFMNENDLDIAACGSYFIRAIDNQILGQRAFEQNLVLEGRGFEYYFPFYHQFMRTIWGKMFKGKTLKNTILDLNSKEIPKTYGNDTFFTMKAFGDAECVGILAKPLHKYYINLKSTSYTFNPERIQCDRILRKAALNFLRPYGIISQSNMKFLNEVHENAIKDTIEVILNAHISYAEKMKWIEEVVSDTDARSVLNKSPNNNPNVVMQLKREVCDWILNQKESGTSNGTECYMKAIKLMLSDDEILDFMLETKKRRGDIWNEIEKRKEIEQIISRYPLIKQLSEELVFSLIEVIKYIMRENYIQALAAYIAKIQIEINEDDIESYFLLGQNLAAIVEEPDIYVSLKKQWFSYLIENGRLKEAENELKDFMEIFPEDEDFLQLEKRMMEIAKGSKDENSNV